MAERRIHGHCNKPFCQKTLTIILRNRWHTVLAQWLLPISEWSCQPFLETSSQMLRPAVKILIRIRILFLPGHTRSHLVNGGKKERNSKKENQNSWNLVLSKLHFNVQYLVTKLFALVTGMLHLTLKLMAVALHGSYGPDLPDALLPAVFCLLICWPTLPSWLYPRPPYHVLVLWCYEHSKSSDCTWSYW